MRSRQQPLAKARAARARCLAALGTIALGLCLAAPAAAQSSFARGTPLDWAGVLTGCFLGFLALTAAYAAAFYMILRDQYLLWQLARILALIALTITLSSLPLGEWLARESEARQVVINLLFDFSVAVIGPFLAAVLEPGTAGPRARRYMRGSFLLVLLITPAKLMADCPPLYMALRNGLLFAMLLLLVFMLVRCSLRGSRAALFQLGAGSLVMLAYGISLYHDLVLGRPFAQFLYVLFAAVALEMLLTTIGAADRFRRLKRQHVEAHASASALDRMAHTDSLTALANRRGLLRQFNEKPPLAAAIIDIDHFKRINDHFGHDAGDKVIIAAAAALQDEGVFAARIGGEEFALLVYTDRAAELAERLRARLSQRIARDVLGLDGPVTASAGLAWTQPGMSFDAMLKAADLELYRAKGEGRNRLALANDQRPAPSGVQAISSAAA